MRLDMHSVAHVVVACLDRHYAWIAMAYLDMRLVAHLDMHSTVAVQSQLQMVEPVASTELDTQALASMHLIVLDRKDKVTYSSLEVVACPSPTTEK